ncbi:MAG: VanZ family protein [Gammaproteobacteria bacterium]|nr:VanZ family protein [Gammaproteobacteria bacterium]
MLLVVAVLSLIPVPQSPEGSDKVAHIVIYAILSGWFSVIVSRQNSLWRVFIGVAAYGALIELLQGQTGYRSLELADAVANTIGAALGVVCHFTRLRQVLVKLDYRLSASR